MIKRFIHMLCRWFKIHAYDFPMAGNTATMILYNPERKEVLLGLRSEDSDAFPNRWSLPGGYLNVGTERMTRVASRETKEEVNLDIDEWRWNIFYLDDEIGTDPRYTQVINICYDAIVSEAHEYDNPVAGDDLRDVEWYSIENALKVDLPFNHNTILREFVQQL